MTIVVYDHKGVLSCHIMELGETVTAEVYLTFLKTTLRDAIRKKRPDLYQADPLLLYDNTRPHKTKAVLKILEDLHWQSLPHLLYSPDLSPPDYDIIAKIKNSLKGKKFISVNELRISVSNVVREINKRGSTKWIDILPTRWEAVINTGGDYIID